MFYPRWSVGSVLFLASWAVLMGPFTYIRHLLSGPRLPFTAAYFGSIALTLYFAVGVRMIQETTRSFSLFQIQIPLLFRVQLTWAIVHQLRAHLTPFKQNTLCQLDSLSLSFYPPCFFA